MTVPSIEKVADLPDGQKKKEAIFDKSKNGTKEKETVLVVKPFVVHRPIVQKSSYYNNLHQKRGETRTQTQTQPHLKTLLLNFNKSAAKF